MKTPPPLANLKCIADLKLVLLLEVLEDLRTNVPEKTYNTWSDLFARQFTVRQTNVVLSPLRKYLLKLKLKLALYLLKDPN